MIYARSGLKLHIGTVISIPATAHNPHRGQYAAEAMLGQLNAGGEGRVLGVVDLDLYVPGLNFIFVLAGRLPEGAQAGGRAIIALPRLRQSLYSQREDRGLFLSRPTKEAVHEIGHTYGLRHCTNRRCVMAFSNTMADTDYKTQEFCPRFKKKWKTGGDQ